MTSTIRLNPTDRARIELAALVDPEVDLSRVRLRVGGPPTWYLRAVRLGAITLGNNVWFVSEAKRADIHLVTHELVHVAQYRRMGALRFLAHYLRDLARVGFRYSRDLPLEAPAYARQAEARRILSGPPTPHAEHSSQQA